MRARWTWAVAWLGGGLSASVVIPAEASVHALEGARSGNSEARDRVAVLPVEDRSTLPPSIEAQLRDAIEQGLRRADDEVVSDELVDREIGAKGCDLRCTATLAETLDAAWVLRSTITRVDTVYEVRLDAIDAHGRSLASAEERCEICGLDEVNELLLDRSAALAAKVELLQRHPPRIALRSRPSGATVWIDEQLVGHTPLEHEVEVGEHEVRLELQGYATERRRVTAVAGTRDSIEVALYEVPEPRRGPWRGLGGAALGTGAALLGVGIGLAVLDEREYERRCNPDPMGHCSHRYDTLGGGIAAMVGGGVLLATGVAVLVVGHRSERAGAARAATRWRIDRGIALVF